MLHVSSAGRGVGGWGASRCFFSPRELPAATAFPLFPHLTTTTDVFRMDSMTAASRLHRSWGKLPCTLGGSFSTTISAELSRTLGRISPSLTCRESVERRRRERRGGHLRTLNHRFSGWKISRSASSPWQTTQAFSSFPHVFFSRFCFHGTWDSVGLWG